MDTKRLMLQVAFHKIVVYRLLGINTPVSPVAVACFGYKPSDENEGVIEEIRLNIRVMYDESVEPITVKRLI